MIEGVPSIDSELIARFSSDCFDASQGMLEAEDRMSVAVSGGSDSLALLLLSREAFPDRLRAVSIDHGLRPEAGEECSFVAELCQRLGISHDIVRCDVRQEGEGLQAAARSARYKEFGTWCQMHRVKWLMTGHHADDQAETLLMRLARGSGVAGLSAIDPMKALPFDHKRFPKDHDFRFAAAIRPLLSWRREELADIVRAAGLTAVVDPSNSDPRYDRTRFRALLSTTDLLDARRLAETASHCRDADRALGWMALTLEKEHVRKTAESIEIHIDGLRPWHSEIMRRILISAFRHFRVWPLPRARQLERFQGLLHAGRPATLAGIKAISKDGVWVFRLAPPRRSH